MEKLTLKNIRHGIQIGLAVFLLYLGWRFYQFVLFFSGGQGGSPVPRPPAVESFLPISALMSFRVWLTTGVFDKVHPAGLAIFLAILATALLLRKGFCGWLCPVGSLSEALGLLGKRWGIQVRMPKVLDILLKSLKYLVLGFFAKVIFIDMPVVAVQYFLVNDYNKVADVKMLNFFLNLSSIAVIVLLVLAGLSVVFRHFWCRYLCPYGALMGILGLLSPVAVKREESHCIDCKKCDKVCPSDLRVSQMNRVYSPECVGCMNCVDACPKKEALTIKAGPRVISGRYYAVALMAVFFGIIFWAKVSGHWHTSISLQEFAKLIPMSDYLNHF
ncbi:4Fe-4S binding protein [Metallumcola ferriviriculae]|uniref:4Fe-4S binding protein n=1 Tax=Metallumcola ferriviriculae TaxID=3039180 RepID=A0AAU0UQQ7_9FIRM|nr:4Fe-4S binding protein [Desulfitibacteraceae bacterium MK1]